MQTKVFISHQWQDKQLADQLKQEIENLTTAEVWIDYRNLRPGDKIQETIDHVIEDMDVILVVWSPHSGASEGVAAEIEAADRLGKRLIPCFVSYSDSGDVLPPIRHPLSEYLGIDFHHFATGIATLASLLLELQDEHAELGMADDPRMRMVHAMREAAGYLANYRDMKGVEDDRRYWITQIVAELERYVGETGDVAMAARMAAGLESIRDEDPEAYATAMARLGPILGATASVAPAPSPAPTIRREDESMSWRPPVPERDMLDQALVAAGVASDELSAYRQAVESYLANTETALRAMASAVDAAGSPAGARVVEYLDGYLREGDDLIPDHYGTHGYLDDAWLVLNTAFRVIESGALTVQQIPIDWQTVLTVDPVVRTLIPPMALAALEQQIMNLLQIIASEVTGYRPWMTPTGHGYAPVMATGGSWEDQMASGLAELGLSW